MKAKNAPVVAVLFAVSFAFAVMPGFAQLPPTNMGKFVHTPGDNQYTQATQMTRHPELAPKPVVTPSGQMMLVPVWRKTPKPRMPDPTIQPIAADEPVLPKGFPPVPDQIDVPTTGSGGAWTSSPSKFAGGRYSDGSRPGGTTPNAGYKCGTPAPIPLEPRAGTPGGQTSNAGYKCGTPAAIPLDAPAAPGLSSRTPGGSNSNVGYKCGQVNNAFRDNGSNVGYKCGTPAADTFASNPDGPKPPPYTGTSPRALRALGKEPRLDKDTTSQPEAPAPVVVNQSVTQDLSLPDDDFSQSRQGRPNPIARSLKRQVRYGVNRMRGQLMRF